MSLENFIDSDDVMVNSVQTLKEKIKQRRAQMLIMSCIYYEMDSNIVSDHQWQAWADELEKLQKENPDLLEIGFYDKHFKDWDGATGAHLPHRDSWVFRKSLSLLRLHEEGKL